MTAEPMDMLDQLDQCRGRTGRLVGDNVHVSPSLVAKAGFVCAPAKPMAVSRPTEPERTEQPTRNPAGQLVANRRTEQNALRHGRALYPAPNHLRAAQALCLASERGTRLLAQLDQMKGTPGRNGFVFANDKITGVIRGIDGQPEAPVVGKWVRFFERPNRPNRPPLRMKVLMLPCLESVFIRVPSWRMSFMFLPDSAEIAPCAPQALPRYPVTPPGVKSFTEGAVR
jgi:hypothetical protein